VAFILDKFKFPRVSTSNKKVQVPEFWCYVVPPPNNPMGGNAYLIHLMTLFTQFASFWADRKIFLSAGKVTE
jgi:hypothetical protein